MLKRMKVPFFVVAMLFCFCGTAHALMWIECENSSDCGGCEVCIDYECVNNSCSDSDACPDVSECVVDESGCGTCEYFDEEGEAGDPVAPPLEECESDGDCSDCTSCTPQGYCMVVHSGFQCKVQGQGFLEGCKQGFTCIEEPGCYSYCDEISNVTDNVDEICELSGGDMTCFDGYLTCEDLEKSSDSDSSGEGADECWWGCVCPPNAPIWSENGCVSADVCEDPEDLDKTLCAATGGFWTECGSGCGPLTCANVNASPQGCPGVCVAMCACPQDLPVWTPNGCSPEYICDLFYDTDEDGWLDFEDNCPETPNSLQNDDDFDGIGDLCDEDFNLQIGLCEESGGIFHECGNGCEQYCGGDWDAIACPDVCIFSVCACPVGMAWYPDVGCLECAGFDADGDGVLDDEDNCLNTINPQQKDGDEDGIGDKCDTDYDNDFYVNDVDNCPLKHNPDQLDSDGDGIGDLCDEDAPACTTDSDCGDCLGCQEGICVNICTDPEGGEAGEGGGGGEGGDVTITVGDKSRGGCSAGSTGSPILPVLVMLVFFVFMRLRRSL